MNDYPSYPCLDNTACTLDNLAEYYNENSSVLPQKTVALAGAIPQLEWLKHIDKANEERPVSVIYHKDDQVISPQEGEPFGDFLYVFEEADWYYNSTVAFPSYYGGAAMKNYTYNNNGSTTAVNNYNARSILGEWASGGPPRHHYPQAKTGLQYDINDGFESIIEPKVLYYIDAFFSKEEPGNLAPPKVQFTDAVDFGEVPFGLAISKEIVIENTGDGDLELNNLDIPSSFTSGNAFLDGTIVAPGESLTFAVAIAMRSDTEGEQSGNITFNTNDPEAPTVSIALTGVVVEPLFNTADGPASIAELIATGPPMVSSDGQCKFYRTEEEGYALFHYTDKTTPKFSTGIDFAEHKNYRLAKIAGLTVTDSYLDRIIWLGNGTGDSADTYTFHLYSKEQLQTLGLTTSRDLIAEDDDGCVLAGVSNTTGHVNWSDEDGGNAQYPQSIPTGENVKSMVSSDGKCKYLLTNNDGYALFRDNNMLGFRTGNAYFPTDLGTLWHRLKNRGGLDIKIVEETGGTYISTHIWQCNNCTVYDGRTTQYRLSLYSKEEIEADMQLNLTLFNDGNLTLIDQDTDGCILAAIGANKLDETELIHASWTDENGGFAVAQSATAARIESEVFFVPNPAADEVIMDLKKLEAIEQSVSNKIGTPIVVTIKIHNLVGQTLVEQEFVVSPTNPMIEIDTSRLSVGTYLVEGTGVGIDFNSKFIIKR